MIEINNLTTKTVDKQDLVKAINIVLKGEGINPESHLSIVLIGSGRMRKLNKKHRGKNKVTDVLAFPANDLDRNNLGEIVICTREVVKNAKRLNSEFEKELITILIHGTLHILGYDHEKSEAEAKKMEQKQNQYIKETF